MLIIDKKELIRLKLIHLPFDGGDIIEFASCGNFPYNVNVLSLNELKFYISIVPLGECSQSNIFALIKLNKPTGSMEILLLEYNGKSAKNDSLYLKYPVLYSGAQHFIIRKWNLMYKREQDVNY